MSKKCGHGRHEKEKQKGTFLVELPHPIDTSDSEIKHEIYGCTLISDTPTECILSRVVLGETKIGIEQIVCLKKDKFLVKKVKDKFVLDIHLKDNEPVGHPLDEVLTEDIFRVRIVFTSA